MEGAAISLWICSVFVAFNEIPQRELRVRLPLDYHVDVSLRVAFNEIPQRELRDVEALLQEAGDCFRCIQRNPTKGIERVEWFPPVILEY